MASGSFGRLGVGIGTLMGVGIMLGIAKNVIPKKKPKRSKRWHAKKFNPVGTPFQYLVSKNR
jgi:hypothetical protein